ncbi:MAG TPA: SdrD B-like domain-containing protein [Actinophytocola sp.]|uniref:SdrD B-like domain-containing protein n=1 Tax=Actinophytocola sp. TaxID=1872138 RepID=UPI002E0052EF|nr:SdrD B-like domain-containing protein [Actinophytocola sp.]
MTDAFSDDDHNIPILLPSLSFGTGFIALTCGNFSERSDSPVPLISGYKFHDQNRNGVRDPGEPGLAGWTMTLYRDHSDAGQGTGAVTTTTTNGDGYYEFRLDGQLPGDYAVTEENRDGWVRTAGPERHTIRVNPGIGSATLGGYDFGNVETRADAVKVSFDVVDPPAEMTADAEHSLRVRAVLENRGPAPIIDVDDTIVAFGPPDCTFRTVQQTAARRLFASQPVEVVFEVGVTCTEPSFHPFEFRNILNVTTPGVTDPDGSNNYRTTGTTIAVIDESDIAMDGTALDCASRTYVHEHFLCTATATVSNRGDFGPARADILLGLTGPADCVFTLVGGTTRYEDASIFLGPPAVFGANWDVVCGSRSYHDFAVTAQAVLDHLHVVDPDTANNSGAAGDRVEVFERVDLSVANLRITCSERQYETQHSTCVSTVTVANAGPATAVQTRTTVGFTAPADCTVTPAGTQEDLRTLNAGTQATFAKTWTLSCTQARRHTFSTTATITADEPHPEDTNRGNDTRSITWQPEDIKPLSFPSSVNLKKEGVVPVAILSTVEFDAVALVDRQTLTFGATGLESSWIRCGSPGEDVNGDGLLDLICQFDTKKTGLTCTSTSATVMGYSTDGRRFEGQDDIKITGC